MAVNKITRSRGTSYEMVAVVDGQVVRRRFSTRKRATDEYARLRASVNDGTYLAAERSRIAFAEYAEL